MDSILPPGFTLLQVTPRLEAGGVEQATLDMARAVVEAGGRSIVASAGSAMVERLAGDLAQAPETDHEMQGWQVTVTHRELARDGAQARAPGIDPRAAARVAAVQAQEA